MQHHLVSDYEALSVFVFFLVCLSVLAENSVVILRKGKKIQTQETVSEADQKRQ